jgi:hypothetical protein
MNSTTIKKDNRKFLRHFPNALNPMCWHFSSVPPEGSIQLPSDEWTCMFSHIRDVARGKSICFSKESPGCSGASCYFGFKKPGEKAGDFLSSKEKFKENISYANKFYQNIEARKPLDKYLILSTVEKIEDNIDIEVVNLWVNPMILSGLVTLANFDSPENDNVIIPFASGCQSMWTIPYKEQNKNHPKAVIGALDPAMRQYIQKNILLFSVPAQRFHSMAENLEKSFANDNKWISLFE